MDIALLCDAMDDIIRGISSLTTLRVASGLSSSDSHQLENLAKLLAEIQGNVQKLNQNLHAQDPKLLPSLGQLKDAVNDLSDLVEDLSARASRHKQVATGNDSGNAVTKRIRTFLFQSNPITNRLKVTYRIRKIAQEFKGVASKLSQEAREIESKLLTNSDDDVFEKSIETIGREAEKKKIVALLINQNGESAVPVVTIAGVAGIGKARLVQIVCEDKQVKDHFGLPVWVNFGMHETSFDVESIAKRVIESSSAATTDRKCYLLVLDDLRFEIREESLATLHHKLTEAGLSGGAILIATRGNIPVADNIVASRSTVIKPHVHVLEGLSEPECWSLFQQIRGRRRASSHDDSTNHIIQDIEKNILKSCGGVPLAIITTARLLNYRGLLIDDEARVAELKEFLENREFTHYDELPTHQKQCFAYCSLFPENHLIDAERLIHLWLGEGFLTPLNNPVSNQSTREPEEIGREYLNNFLKRSIFQRVEEDEFGAVRSCRMKRLMHDLASVVAGDESIIFTSMDSAELGTKKVEIHERITRALFDFSLDVSRGIPDALFEKAKRLRTILLPAKTHTQARLPREVKMSTSACEKIFTSFKSLRLLDLHDLGIKTVPASIEELRNLRYLDLSDNSIERLPNSITKLSHLQTLKLSNCHVLKELPKDLEDLVNLRHLYLEGCVDLTQMPRGIRKLTSLLTLSLFVASKNYHVGGLTEIARLNNIRGHLEILHLERLKFPSKGAYLKDKERLDRLTLRWEWDHDDDDEEEEEEKEDNGRGMQPHHDKDDKSLEYLEPHSNLKVLLVVGYMGHRLSYWLPSLQRLVKFSLYDSPKCQSLAPLHKLPLLKVLELRRLDSLECIEENIDNNNASGDVNSNTNTNTSTSTSKASSFSISAPTVPFFPSLKELTISDCPNLRSWWKTEKKPNDIPFFACISRLQVQYCPKLTCMPLFPGLDKELVLEGSSIKPLRDTIHSKGADFVALSKLKYMEIASIEEHSPPEESIKNFTSLEELHIRECRRLEYLPQGFKHLSSLRRLTIENCPKLNLDDERSRSEWEGLKNLNSLTIREVPKLESLSWGVENVTSLLELGLYDCPGLSSLPESIGNLTLLGRLVISECRKLESLPKGMENLKSLQTLIITDCPLLLPRCQPETGDDWPQIAHVKTIQVKQTSQEFRN